MPDLTEPNADLIRFGWEEWVALPALGLPALKAKVDTGARTSALHASDIETFGSAAKPKVRFTVHPVPERQDLVIPCSAEIIDRRVVTSSNGEGESGHPVNLPPEQSGRARFTAASRRAASTKGSAPWSSTSTRACSTPSCRQPSASSSRMRSPYRPATLLRRSMSRPFTSSSSQRR